ncbi:VacJ family lipoprotein [Salinisphaera sp. Q1T1-3]|uniref:MlaA family lipoprotein n=1 Tax=Salinisphaera sp. Q1T1-3 TaxID=2321229 RepID=UPI001314BD97|nr:VacJ family lipoprotein [Salinisphaera sp. Q1T1-3]
MPFIVDSDIADMRIRLNLLPHVLLLCVMPLAACVHSPPSAPWDPIEPVNRGVFKFNRVADRYVIRPVAQGYTTITPEPIRAGVGNFFDNLHAPIVMANSLLQLKWGSFNDALGRFMINTTAGVAGLVDVATRLDIADPDEDLGQTLGHWGLGAGPYLVLPFLGPSGGRDLIGFVGDRAWAPAIGDIDALDDEYGYVPPLLTGLDFIDARARLMDLDSVLDSQIDPYAFAREYYLQRRDDEVHDRPIDRRSPPD